jgi:DNA-binding phage protein
VRWCVVVILACGACKPRENPEFKRAHQYVTEFNAWSAVLTDDGAATTRVVFAVLDGKVEAPAAQEAIARQTRNCREKLTKMLAPTGRPTFRAFATWHDGASRYLQWQCDSGSLFELFLTIADDRALSASERTTRVMRVAQEANTLELSRKAELKRLTDDLYAFMNSRGP